MLRELFISVLDRRENDMAAPEVADSILAALDTAGLVVVPREPTEAMIQSAQTAWSPPTTFVIYTTTMREAVCAALAASPYAKGE